MGIAPDLSRRPRCFLNSSSSLTKKLTICAMATLLRFLRGCGLFLRELGLLLLLFGLALGLLLLGFLLGLLVERGLLLLGFEPAPILFALPGRLRLRGLALLLLGLRDHLLFGVGHRPAHRRRRLVRRLRRIAVDHGPRVGVQRRHRGRGIARRGAGRRGGR